jgi:Spy/CpxP family protein refolding chaperone
MKDGEIMKLAPNKLFQFIVPAAMLGILSISGHAQGTQQQQNSGETAQTQMTQADQMLGPLNLTQDQIQKIRSINTELREERREAGMRLRLAQRALTEAIQSPAPDESLISQRSKEVADAQANTIRLRSLTEARILQVLSPEQRIKLRELRQEALVRRNGNQQQLPRALQRRPNAVQRTQNPNALTPRQQRRLMQQQARPRP